MKPEKKRAGSDGAVWALRGVALVLIVSIAILTIHLARRLGGDGGVSAPEATPPETGTRLATPEDFLPQNLVTGMLAPEASLATAEGERVSLDAVAGQGENGAWLVFWASWCPDCEAQLESIERMEQLAGEYGFELVLVDRLNPEKESMAAAREALERRGAQALCLYDAGEACYGAWGLREIPSAVVLDREGRVLDCRSGVMTTGACEGMLRRAKLGRSAATRDYIENNLMGDDGAIYAVGDRAKDGSSAGEALSESQGLMMLYAANTGDQALFDRVWGFVKDHMLSDAGLVAWRVSEDGAPAGVNALLDDLRIWSALRRAALRWGGDYGDAADRLLDAIAALCLNADGMPVDYVEFETGQRADGIALCYLDIEILDAMAALSPALEGAAQGARALLESGMISEDFPLYYARYNYQKKDYEREELNAAEALYTVWNLAKAGYAREETLAWLRERVERGELAARYDVNGRPVPGYDYHSTAVYALAALIAREVGDDELHELALRRMERMLVIDVDDRAFGSFGQRGGETYAFDQLIPLAVYAQMEGEAGI